MGEIVGIVLVPLLAVIAPLVARLVSRWLVLPVIVLEILLGIAVGPSGLGWVQSSMFVSMLSEIGLAMLFFVAGTEIDFRAIAGRPLRRSVIAWGISFALALGIGLLQFSGWEAAIVIAVALSSTALGAVLPIIRDAGLLGTPFGTAVSAVGAVGEFGPLIAISLFLGSRDLGTSSIVLFAFVAVAIVLVWLSVRLPHRGVHRLVSATLNTTAQFAIRLILLILAALVALSLLLDLDILLGAFCAGVIWRIVIARAPEADRELVSAKIDGLAFGFLIPIFFISTGIGFDLAALLAEPMLLLLALAMFVALFVVRGLPAQLAAPRGASGRDRFRLALYAATGLPLIVAVTAIGQDAGVLSAGVASALVAAGMLSVLVFPLLAAIGRPAAPVSRGFEESIIVVDDESTR
ncbi:MAG TPA: cation:proton antiporter [Microbacteriaceae bacterium]|nr:cation:proton antiporter [Microbacteriaceae bacterium]